MAWHSRRVNERGKSPCIKDPLLPRRVQALHTTHVVLARPWVGVCVSLALRLSS